ncbi:hypothetical protein V1478_004008 [Vespula squamosa]|uniref:Uncharacterized protein n=1 Tax=Vespula squamosa TaxID=30214 RepID=A0ABD2BNR9_VESSQ
MLSRSVDIHPPADAISGSSDACSMRYASSLLGDDVVDLHLPYRLDQRFHCSVLPEGHKRFTLKQASLSSSILIYTDEISLRRDYGLRCRSYADAKENHENVCIAQHSYGSSQRSEFLRPTDPVNLRTFLPFTIYLIRIYGRNIDLVTFSRFHRYLNIKARARI